MEQGSSGQPFYLNDSDSCTVDQIKTSDLRSLGDNVKLLAVIQNLSHDLVTKSENTYKKLDEIQRETEIKSVGVKNLINEFQMLADSQFIENRIYDADESDSPPEEFNKNIIDEENNKTPADQKILPIIHECISHSLKFIDENFNFNDKPLKQTSAESDDEEDYVKETLARAMESNPFNRTPLPAIIGSKAFFSQNIFDGGENHTENNQNDNNSTISSDRKSSLQSDNEEEDDETLFSPSKGVSIQHGIIPPPPPLPNFSYFADSRKDIEDDEDDEDEELFKQTETEPKSLQGKLPEIKPNQSWNHESDHDSDDSDDLFKPPPQMNPRKSLESTKFHQHQHQTNQHLNHRKHSSR
ncbi:WASH complex subunit 2-like [Panonychus citri]|uniref:WASH complex subunit 2-like n=1 Tax=Panonychus citri TaxID=50023 RepID=UPI0023075B02|nr:WASH complex subunit 2-like [Panonychus citri]